MFEDTSARTCGSRVPNPLNGGGYYYVAVNYIKRQRKRKNNNLYNKSQQVATIQSIASTCNGEK